MAFIMYFQTFHLAAGARVRQFLVSVGILTGIIFYRVANFLYLTSIFKYVLHSVI